MSGNKMDSAGQGELTSSPFGRMENIKNTANASQVAENLYALESANLMADFRLSLALAVGDEAGNPDYATAKLEIAACNERIAKGFESGLLTSHKDKQAKQTKAENTARQWEEFKRETLRGNRLALELFKRRYIKRKNGIALAGETVTSARLGIADKRAHVENEGITRDKLASDNSPCLAIVAATIIKTINFPKGYVKQGETPAKHGDFTLPDKQASKAMRQASSQAKGSRKLSPLEECEVFQTAAMVLIANDALHLEIDGSDTWREKEFGLWSKLYSACRDTLGIDRIGYSEISLPDHDPINPFFPRLRSAPGSSNGLHPKSKFLALINLLVWVTKCMYFGKSRFPV